MTPSLRLALAPIMLAVAGLGAALVAQPAAPTTRLAIVGAASTVSTATSPATSLTTSTTTTTTAPAPEMPPPPATVPATTIPPSSKAPPDLCPCDPVTGEPLGGGAIDKGIDGVVQDAVGRPLAGICVTVNKPAPSVAITTATRPDGTFRVDLGKTGGPPLFQLDVASCDGTSDPWLPAVLRSADLDPNSFNHVRVTLRAAAALAGTAMDQTGRPYTGGCVAVYSPERRVDAPIDAAGHFDARGLPAGDVGAEMVFPCGGPPPPTPTSTATPTFDLSEGQTTNARLTAWRGHTS